MMSTGLHIEIRGTVQGVGFRPFVYRTAHESGVTGWVRNDASGVTIEAFGGERELASFVERLESKPPPAALIREFHTATIPASDAHEFVIVHSDADAERRISIPADLPMCEACQAELNDPANRRYRYPFINCTDCGPRFTIALDVPYDRPATTMAPFTLCADCAREYHDPLDRRFHAQPNACARCGPSLQLIDLRGEAVEQTDLIAATAHALQQGLIVGIKGLGGFHLACDATSTSAVQRLRQRKHREEKPLAVMVADLAVASRLTRLSRAEEALLSSAPRPIVLLTRRHADEPDVPCRDVAPHSETLGLMLPYTPLHHLLLAATGLPLVMTSANLSDEPICYRNDEARERLKDIADLLLVHDREIATRCDDSVARVIAGVPTVLRRSRGYVPHAMLLRQPVERPILACGAHLKNTFCLAVGENAFLGPHIGDLETLDAYDAYCDAIEKLERFVGVTPELMAHDLHPDYLSTRYARERAGSAAIGVQHHHAHLVSAMTERGLTGSCLGLAWDGTGFGLDRTAWGGELLRVEPHRFERLATFRPMALAGADRAIREPWRLAAALLIDAFGDEAPLHELPLFQAIPSGALEVVQQMLLQQVNAPKARGVGRYFDAVGALLLSRPQARFEGQIAVELNMAAQPLERGRYSFAIEPDEDGLWEVDLRPMTWQLVADLQRGVAVATIAARFHNTLARAAKEMLFAVISPREATRVVLSGGCFQNPLLVERIADELPAQFEVVVHRDVPPGDGGISLGQAVIADARARAMREDTLCA